jgi:hypothetical protein
MDHCEVKYRDKDGDVVSLGSTEDVQMAFEAYRPGGQVTLFVTSFSSFPSTHLHLLLI